MLSEGSAEKRHETIRGYFNRCIWLKDNYYRNLTLLNSVWFPLVTLSVTLGRTC